ncbi:MAG TPA: beta-1,6-N-acetylglucosaminyltransferase [Puia sp.]|nr:beta-1,6-N-acetylglucosaminyltransferase [Puia sp.]
MKIAHLILAHKNPAQLQRLLDNLQHPDAAFFIHLDKKIDAAPFAYLFQRPNTFPVRKRTKIYWAGFGTIQGILNGFAEIPRGYDYINVISGQDFPLKPAEYIHRYITERKGKEFITCQTIDGTSEWGDVSPRVRKYHLINWRIPGRHRLENLLNKVLPPRKFPMDHELVGRANWFTLSYPAVQYLLRFLHEHPELIRYYKYCWGADEFIFSTILYNSHFKPDIVENLLYCYWESGHGHAKTLKTEDLEILKASDKLLARKFDMDADPEIFDMLEDWMKKNPG